MDNELVSIYCDECGEYVPADNWDEHKDYHVAVQLQKSINQSSTRTLLSPQAIKRQSRSVDKGSPMVSKKAKLHTLDKYLTKK